MAQLRRNGSVKSALCESPQSVIGTRKHPDWFQESISVLTPLYERGTGCTPSGLAQNERVNSRRMRREARRGVREARNACMVIGNGCRGTEGLLWWDHSRIASTTPVLVVCMD